MAMKIRWAPGLEDPGGRLVDGPPHIGAGLRKLRTRRGLSLERLARASGVSRAMLSQIELGQSAPTITVLWKIAKALDLGLASLISFASARRPIVLRADRGDVQPIRRGGAQLRPLFPREGPTSSRLWEVRLPARGVEHVPAEPAGTTKTLTVSQGAVELDLEGASYPLDTGDTIVFEADVDHVVRTRGEDPATLYLLVVLPPGLR